MSRYYTKGNEFINIFYNIYAPIQPQRYSIVLAHTHTQIGTEKVEER